ncbi:MAG TPA: tripartite tricarboxylate transporter substrate binding protein [Burkholderiaceae bacterium]|jgi:tripartite-type tricarboxylate transporter receptor subunit TctC|nr:tripartite tricarboxylate transporter substrate binding protein [Burkholderiaceae bacterium]
MTRIALILRLALLAAFTLGAVPASQAQTYPARAVKIIVPFPPGGAIDALGRLLAQKMSESWGQPVVVENRPGAGGIIGTDAGAKAPADGHTLTMGAVSTHAINVGLYKKLPYDPVKDFAAVAPVAIVPNLLVVNPSLGVSTIAELIALARSKPGQLSYASAGAGTTLHISCELFKSLAKVDIVHVPYKGSAPAISDVMGGQVPIMCDSITSSQPHIKAGKLKVLAITSVTRSSTMPQVPTMVEAGVAGYEMNPWFGLFAPAGTPAAVVARVHGEVARILALPDVRERLSAIGAEPMSATPDQFSAMVRADVEKWGRLVRAAGISAD